MCLQATKKSIAYKYTYFVRLLCLFSCCRFAVLLLLPFKSETWKICFFFVRWCLWVFHFFLLSSNIWLFRLCKCLVRKKTTMRLCVFCFFILIVWTLFKCKTIHKKWNEWYKYIRRFIKWQKCCASNCANSPMTMTRNHTTIHILSQYDRQTDPTADIISTEQVRIRRGKKSY